MNIRQIVDQQNWHEFYNAYAVWIQSNRWAFKNAASLVKIPFNKVKSPYGIRNFISSSLGCSEEEIKKIESASSKFLGTHPESFTENADIFASTFPYVIAYKSQKNAEKQKKSEAKLDEFFVQETLPLKENSASTVILNETVSGICALADKGAKTIETPDGWKVAF